MKKDSKKGFRIKSSKGRVPSSNRTQLTNKLVKRGKKQSKKSKAKADKKKIKNLTDDLFSQLESATAQPDHPYSDLMEMTGLSEQQFSNDHFSMLNIGTTPSDPQSYKDLALMAKKHVTLFFNFFRFLQKEEKR